MPSPDDLRASSIAPRTRFKIDLGQYTVLAEASKLDSLAWGRCVQPNCADMISDLLPTVFGRGHIFRLGRSVEIRKKERAAAAFEVLK